MSSHDGLGCCEIGNWSVLRIASPKSNQSGDEMLRGSELALYIWGSHDLVLCDSTDNWSVLSKRWSEMPPCERVLDLKKRVVLVSVAVVAHTTVPWHIALIRAPLLPHFPPLSLRRSGSHQVHGTLWLIWSSHHIHLAGKWQLDTHTAFFFFLLLKSIKKHDMKVKFALTSSSLSLFHYEVTSSKSRADRAEG